MANEIRYQVPLYNNIAFEREIHAHLSKNTNEEVRRLICVGHSFVKLCERTGISIRDVSVDGRAPADFEPSDKRSVVLRFNSPDSLSEWNRQLVVYHEVSMLKAASQRAETCRKYLLNGFYFDTAFYDLGWGSSLLTLNSTLVRPNIEPVSAKPEVAISPIEQLKKAKQGLGGLM